MEKNAQFKNLLRYITLTAGGRDAQAPDGFESCRDALRDAELLPLLNVVLKSSRAPGISSSFLAEIEAAGRQTLARQIVFAKALVSLRTSLAASGIDALPLKGIHLAEHVYPAPGARQMSDIDILVPREKFNAALDVMRADGYRGRLDFMAERGGQLPSGVCFTGGPHGGTPIDVHYSLINTCGIKSLIMSRGRAAELDSDAMASAITGADGAPCLSPPFFLLSLMLHHYTHNFREIQWHIDTAVYSMKMQPRDWDVFHALLEKFKLAHLASLYFALCADSLGCSTRELFPDGMARMAEAVKRTTRAAAALRAGRLTPFQSLMFLPGTHYRAAALARFIFPSKYYLETVSGKPVPAPAYMAELLKFQARALRR